jgi:hypothetical protein
MRYMMLVCVGGDPDAAAEPVEPVEPWVEEMDGRGVRLMGNELRPLAESVSVRVRGGEMLRTDGPFAETKEAIAGFDLLDCKDLGEAIEIAAKHPMARRGRIELREFAG